MISGVSFIMVLTQNTTPHTRNACLLLALTAAIWEGRLRLEEAHYACFIALVAAAWKSTAYFLY